jgi:hypothetical protein
VGVAHQSPDINAIGAKLKFRFGVGDQIARICNWDVWVDQQRREHFLWCCAGNLRVNVDVSFTLIWLRKRIVDIVRVEVEHDVVVPLERRLSRQSELGGPLNRCYQVDFAVVGIQSKSRGNGSSARSSEIIEQKVVRKREK